ncbi:hypothetical protein [Amycolatopsis sp. 195334CR]|uniref:hypothetical protein n=1 Tax=Amycolatopsis sp. 195334CR TaxID=2814588 RepID=UPI001A8CAEAB|nr:hypothetical protein [Amycolatopsis sp. 195334CR]MBN6033586.1 hypothetical protein [Amycolatopsis sp. 195334CR]
MSNTRADVAGANWTPKQASPRRAAPRRTSPHLADAVKVAFTAPGRLTDGVNVAFAASVGGECCESHIHCT